MCSYSNVADLARRMRIAPEVLLTRFREAGVTKTNVQSPVYDQDVAALSAHYRELLGARAIEIVEGVRKESRKAPGNCGVLRYMPSGDAVTNIRLAVTDRYRKACERLISFGQLPSGSRSLFFLDLLQNRAPAEMRSLASSILRTGLRVSEVDVSQADRFQQQVASVRTSHADDVQSCNMADRAGTIHPAFAPPAAVI